MGSFKTFFIVLMVFSCSFALPNNIDKRQILYLMQTDKTEKALDLYIKLYKTQGHDLTILQNISTILLEKGSKNIDPEIQKLTMYGAGISGSTHALKILEEGFYSNNPEIQLISLHFLSFLHEDRIQFLLNESMSSPFIQIRMEALYQMAERKHPSSVGHIESLMHRLPKEVKFFFPHLFAMIATPEAIQYLKHFLYDEQLPVRIEAILGAAHFGKDELLPMIQKKLTHTNIAELEAAIYAILRFQDSSSVDKIKKTSLQPSINVKLASHFTLFNLGEETAKTFIENEAKKNNLFAISLLAEIPGSETILKSLINSHNIEVRINSAISLLRLKDSSCIPVLKDIFIKDYRDISLQPFYSLGRTMMYFKVAFSSEQIYKDNPTYLALALNIKEHILRLALELEEKDFLQVADMIFDNMQNDLVPLLIHLIENIRSKESINLLKEKSQKPGAPLIRDYCNLALFRIKEEGNYEEYIRNWIFSQKNENIIELRPFLPRQYRIDSSMFELSAEEKTRLLVEMYQAISIRQNDKNILTVVEALKTGNPKNRYALAGILLKAIE